MFRNTMTWVFSVAVVTAGNTAATAAPVYQPQAFVNSIDAFLIRQATWFDGTRPAGQPPLVQTFGWDTALSFPPSQLNPPTCVNPPGAPTPLPEMAWRGDIYDQSLTAIWFIERGRLDYLQGRDPGANLGRARQLLDAGVFLGNHDPSGDGRLRMAYWANNLLNPAGTESSIMAPDASTGNISYFGIALTRFYDVARQSGYLDPETRQSYLNIAEQKGRWILNHCTDQHPNGFTGGYSGWNQARIGWKSTEHNIDAWVFAQNLYTLTGNHDWKLMADRAGGFVQSMYVDVDAATGYYLTGTREDGLTPNNSPIPADAQAWTALARGGGQRIDSDQRAQNAMRWLEGHLKDGSETVPLPAQGVKFSDVAKNMQSEVTASAALAELWLGQNTGEAENLLTALCFVQNNAVPDFDGIGGTIGMAASPGLEGAWTGYGSDAWYYNLLHVASSSWAGLADLYAQEGDPWANPLRPLDVPEPATASLTMIVAACLAGYVFRRGTSRLLAGILRGARGG